MKTTISSLLFLFSLASFGQAEVEQKKLYTPQEALNDINSGKLVFMGRDLFPGNDQNRTCVYKSERAYVLYNNCMSSKKESVATDIEVYAFEGGSISFYVQNATAEIPVSKVTRSDYNMTWKVYSEPTPKMGKMTMKELMDFKENISFSGCGIGRTFEAQNMNSEILCMRGYNGAEGITEILNFWREPGEEWYATLRLLRKTVVETKF